LKFRIIRHFIQNQELRQNQTQIARSLRTPTISVSRHIRDLVKLRILHEERQGRAAVYTLNQASALVNRFLAQVVSLNGNLIRNWVVERLEFLRPAERKLLDRVVLFGSAARGDFSTSSDIDLLVVVSSESKRLEYELRSNLVAQGGEAGFTINLQVESAKRFKSPEPTGYLRVAREEGVVFWRK